jgi:glucuronate isomerase
MSIIKADNFITENFLLHSKMAEILFHSYAKNMPIIDYHNHLSPKQLSENKSLGNITNAWLKEDHYKWRAMRANGIDEYYITGNATNEEKFNKWAETVPKTLRNPLFHWTQLELKRYFDIDQVLQPSTTKNIYSKTNAILETKTPIELLHQMKVEVICTTDNPTDSLEYHQQITKKNIAIKVLPTFRSDELFLIDTVSFLESLEKLKNCVGFPINSLESFLNAIDLRIKFFNDNGCKLSDFGVGAELIIVDFEEQEVSLIFKKRLKNDTLTAIEIDKFRTCVFYHLGRQYHKYNWVQQYHLGAIRNNNKKLQSQFGNDAGCDSIGDYSMAEFMSKLFGQLDFEEKLPKTITYNLNPSQNDLFATMMGNFNTGGQAGKMQWGAAWWFMDQKQGIENQINTLSNIGLLSNFIGMLTDSRSLLSFPRHEYFRRILCNLIAEDINNGILPNDILFIGKMIQDICYNNAKKYFGF